MEKDLKLFFDRICKKYVYKREYYTFGFQEAYKKNLLEDLGYINFFTNLKFDFVDRVIPLTNDNNRCGDLRESTMYITVHDTASGAPNADTYSHDRWLWSMATDPKSTHSVSWHYIVDDKTIIKHLPTDEVGYHAGDGTRTKLDFINTNVLAKDKNTIIINDDGYFVVNDCVTSISSPRDDNNEVCKKLPALGINYIIDEVGNIWISNTYYNSTYKTVSNRGGNLNSVGIETCVNLNNDYIKTMRVNSYLVAKLLLKYNLGIDRVLQHNSFSGKDCPMTMRHNNLWNEFIELVSIYKEYFEKYANMDIKFESLDKEFLDDDGKIIKFENNHTIRYKVICDGEEIIYESTLKDMEVK